MARRKTKRKKSRRDKSWKLLNTVEGVLIGSQVTRSLFGMNLIPFMTEGWLTPTTKTHISQMGGMGSEWMQAVSAKELIESLVPGGASGGLSSSFGIQKAMRANFKTFGTRAIITAIAIPIGFRVGKRVFGNWIRPVNRVLKDTRIGVKL